MKNLVCLFCLITSSFAISAQHIYFNFVSHNEETSNWNGNPFYTVNRGRLISLADTFAAKGITWNMQSDWVFLTNVLGKETPSLMLQTNNKNILRWMHEDKGVEMDPHAHESQYLYPDVVKLMDSVGLPESKVIGGTIYNDSNGINIWTNLVNGQYGLIYPTKFWQPDYMMGGGTPNHVNDLRYYGFWNPQSPASYLTRDTATRLRHLGTGCTMKITDTTNVATFMNDLRNLVNRVQSGEYPTNGFYVQTLFFSQADLNNMAFYNKLIEIADSANNLVNSSMAEWKTFKQAYTIWETTYAKQAFQWNCGQIATVIPSSETETMQLQVYPNPCEDWVQIKGIDEQYSVLLLDLNGKEVYHFERPGTTMRISLQLLPTGVYVICNGSRHLRLLHR